MIYYLHSLPCKQGNKTSFLCVIVVGVTTSTKLMSTIYVVKNVMPSKKRKCMNIALILLSRESGQPAMCFKGNTLFSKLFLISLVIWRFEVLGEKTTLQYNRVIQ